MLFYVSTEWACRMTKSLLFTIPCCLLSVLDGSAFCEDDASKASANVPGCSAQAAFREAWGKVVERACLKCHRQGGDAEDSKFVLQDVSRLPLAKRAAANQRNCLVMAKMAKVRERGGRARMLVKATGGQDHGGGEVIEGDSTEFRVLKAYIRGIQHPPARPATPRPLADPHAPPFFDGVVMLDDQRLLRRATLSLAGRLPTEEEMQAVAVANGRVAERTSQSDGQTSAKLSDERRRVLDGILSDVMREDAFYERLREAFNDIFLTRGVNGNPDATVLSYEHFQKTRLWYQRYDLSHIKDEKERRQAGYKLANDYRAALLSEPMKLIEHIVQNERPFTEIITADYIMVTPYTARGYGVFDELKKRFKNPDDPFEYVPVKLKALVGRNKSQNQESPTGFYPHAGLLSTFQYLNRYPTTETNRNRLRARMFYQHFLGIDVLELAARVSDAAAVTAKFETPTMQAAECAVCHKTVDPVAGLFQDYWRFEANFAIYGRRKGGWFTDMFAAGFEGEKLPADERWRALQWLGERTAKDPRFAVAMTEHAYYLLAGRRPLLPPKDIDDPLFPARRRAYQEQRSQIEAIATQFAETGFNFKQVVKEWVFSDFYRADGLATVAKSPARRAELDDIGVVRLLSPEQLERKVTAVFGKPWGRLNGQTAMLYGGIDSKAVTERASDPSGAMGAIQRTLSNDVACRNVAFDFSRKPADRLLFPEIAPDVLPGESRELDERIRRAIAHLHRRVLGRTDADDSDEVKRTFELFAGIVAEAKRSKFDARENWSCRQGLERPVADPHYTVRAWRAVVTYLLRRQEFLYA